MTRLARASAVSISSDRDVWSTRTQSLSRPIRALNVVIGMTAWYLSWLPYELVWVFFCMIPMTVNGELLMSSVLPTGSSLPKMSSASS